jgi:hypothetical protein
MDPESRLTTLLQRAVERCEVPEIDGRVIGRRVRRRRMAVVTAALLVLALGLVAVAVAREDNGPEDVLAGRGQHTGSMSAAELASGRWSSAPTPPLSRRSEALVIWAGDRLVVWSGVDPRSSFGGSIHRDDGATYDPATRRWAKMAPAPIAGRDGELAVWTGREVLVWGGRVGLPGIGVRDGAAYDPEADRWRRIEPLPFDAIPAAVWTGHEAVVFSPDNRVAAYDPVDDGWRSLPGLPGPGKTAVVTAGWAGDRMFISRSWTMPPRLGLLFATLRQGDRAWHELRRSDHQPYDPGEPLWTGRTLLVEDLGSCPWPISCPPRKPRLHEVDLGRERWRTVALPVGAVEGVDVWTGGALVEVAPDGTTLLWDPDGDRSTTAATAPEMTRARGVWTGREILVWDESALLATREKNAAVLRRFGP